MESKGYPHPTEPSYPQNTGPNSGIYGHPQPPPAYEAGISQGGGYHPVQHQPLPITHTIIAQPPVGPEPSSLICPSCHHQILTRLDYETTTRTHLMAGLLCAFVCWPCAWIPYVMDSCKNANHYCPKCGAFIGTYKP